jgi:TfoX/Sxy family transcriptional regulator of competence genes
MRALSSKPDHEIVKGVPEGNDSMTAKKEEKGIPSDKLALYDKLIQTNPDLERKGAKLPYTSVNGHMFTFLSEAGVLAIRLPKAEREAFLKKYSTTLMEAHGTIMKEYVAVPDNLLDKTKELKKYLDISYEYARTLKPKPQKRSK